MTIVAWVNDLEGNVAAIIDPGLVEAKLIQCHPMENTSTVVMSPTDIVRYLSHFGREVTVIDVPATTSRI